MATAIALVFTDFYTMAREHQSPTSSSSYHSTDGDNCDESFNYQHTDDDDGLIGM